MFDVFSAKLEIFKCTQFAIKSSSVWFVRHQAVATVAEMPADR